MIILGLGSNVGDRLGYLRAAVRLLSGIMQDMQLTRIFESEALLSADATKDMNLPYLNMALSASCALAPDALLRELKRMEREIGRVDRGIWAPREIDMDILAMDTLCLESEGLNIPHKELLNRDFAMIPMRDIAPDWKYPLAGAYYNKTVREICAEKNYVLGANLRDTGFLING